MSGTTMKKSNLHKYAESFCPCFCLGPDLFTELLLKSLLCSTHFHRVPPFSINRPTESLSLCLSLCLLSSVHNSICPCSLSFLRLNYHVFSLRSIENTSFPKGPTASCMPGFSRFFSGFCMRQVFYCLGSTLCLGKTAKNKPVKPLPKSGAVFRCDGPKLNSMALE